MVQYGEPVRPVKEVEAVGMEVSPKGETIIDFGQNLAGVLRVKGDLPAGTKLILDHFETKDSQGNYFNNIAGADMTGHTQTDVDRKSTRLNSSHKHRSRMPSSA